MPTIITMGAASARAFGFARVLAAKPSQQAYTTPGTYSWVAPAGVTSVSVVAVGGGGGTNGYGGNDGGSGGGLRYINNYTVIPGISYNVSVGSVGQVGNSQFLNTRGGTSSFSCSVVYATGGVSGDYTNSYTPDACGYYPGGDGSTIAGSIGGGNGGKSQSGRATAGIGGAGGAGGYSGAGGNGGGARYGEKTPTTGSGGGGGGGGRGGTNYCGCFGGGGSNLGGLGGGVGILGSGSNGTAGTNGINSLVPTVPTAGTNGGAGSGGSGKFYGGGSISCSFYGGSAVAGGTGAVRIIWPGTTRQFPSTCTGNK